MAKANTLPDNRPITAKVAPKESAPVSPRNRRAGKTLKYKKAIKPPVQTEIKINSGVSKIEIEIAQKANSAITRVPLESPSSPSVTFTALAKATMIKAANGINHQERS